MENKIITMIKKIPMGLRGTEEIIISTWQELKLTSHKIYRQISLSWKVTLVLRGQE